MTHLPTFLLVSTFSAATLFGQSNAHDGPAPVQQRSYIDDDDQRRLANLQFGVDPQNRKMLRISIGAMGPVVEPIAGFRGVRGANRYTAEELDLILQHEHEVRVITRYDHRTDNHRTDNDRTDKGIADKGIADQGIAGRLLKGQVGSIPERQLRPDGRIDFLGRTLGEYPLEILVDTQAESSGVRTTMVLVNGQARLRCRYNIVNGQVKGLEVQSLGSDHSLAALKPSVRDRLIRTQAVTVSVQPPGPPVTPADWNSRDSESQWVLFHSDIQQDSSRITAWVEFLQQQQDHEFLEWIALYVPDAFKTHNAGNALAEARAPQWLRVVVWHCNGVPNFGHGLQQASQLLLYTQPGIAEHWLSTHQKAIDNWKDYVEHYLPRLINDRIPPQDSSDLLPPLRPDDVFQHLNAPAEVFELGIAEESRNDVVYVHQVIRAIDGVVVSGRRSQPLIQRVRRLTNHSHEDIRQAAYLAFSYLAPGMPKTDRFDDFMAVIDDVDQSERIRESALMGYSYHSHPHVLLKLHDVAAQPRHPAWKAAVSRLGDVGKSFSIALLNETDAAGLSDEHQAILKDAVRRLTAAESAQPQVTAWDMTTRVALAAHAQSAQHHLAADILHWVQESALRLPVNKQLEFNRYGVSSLGEFWKPVTDEEFLRTFDAIKNSVVKSF